MEEDYKPTEETELKPLVYDLDKMELVDAKPSEYEVAVYLKRVADLYINRDTPSRPRRATTQDIREATREPGWNGYDAEPISETILGNAHKIETRLPELMWLHPRPDGNVEFSNVGESIILEVFNDHYTLLDYTSGQEVETEYGLDWDAELLKAVFNIMIKEGITK